MAELPAQQASFIDRARQSMYDLLWQSAMQFDRWMGSTEDPAAYRQAFGSIAPAVLWDQHYGLTTPLRFNVYLPLPRLDDRLHVFVGRLDPNEYVTESEEPSGTFRRQYGTVTQDQTLFGLVFQQDAHQGGHFDAGAGMRISLPLDPYVKGSYIYIRGTSEEGLVALRETVFWERMQRFGVTSRADIERIWSMHWLTHWTGSATLSQSSIGMLGWSAVDVTRGFATRRAIALELEVDGQTDAPVPLHSYGAKLAYRQSVLRKWLILEVRTSVAWPKDALRQERRLSPGVGMGFEILIGTERFLARPITF
jgi:hypothetical protein